jgi:uncharacterized membrane protein
VFLFVCLCRQTKTQYRDTVNIGYTRHRTKTNKQKTQHIATVSLCCVFCLFVSVLCLVYPMLTVSLCCVLFLFIFVLCLVYPMLKILSTFGTPDRRQRQTNKNTTHRYCQHWVHQKQDKECFLFVCLCPVSGVPNVDSISVLCFCLSLSCVWCNWVHQTQDRDKQTKTQYRDTVNICLVYPMLTVSLCCVFVCLSLSCFWCTQC